ncbi:hypothetical protein ASPWEDRAFT_38634 [Aspergillus wentii DTO 134E9]|uniref:Uncharacterized protein n=1 Tax=Aspergillus wentii DTO 134E9 TaxID=1073089 RepID=A0A1L9RPX9_ASPWE|nr:uncharacterized protein ASPWEDRAFT_38634 [Aspergillus wentii DTO 134E9]OJJ36989.1 hypothetical protein ASPWEDRAFT_38634 [Aspergillus wentii DTO 134E9]
MVYEALVFEESRGGFKQPTCVMSMMELILGIATGPFMRKTSFEGNKIITKEAMEIFRESIRYVADSEIQLFNSFENSLDPKNNKNGNGSNAALNPWHNLHEETKFLREIKDIQDELKILRTLAEAQETVWNQTFDDDHFKDRSICTPMSVKAEVDRMIEEADKTHDSVGYPYSTSSEVSLTVTDQHAARLEAETSRHDRRPARPRAEQNRHCLYRRDHCLSPPFLPDFGLCLEYIRLSPCRKQCRIRRLVDMKNQLASQSAYPSSSSSSHSTSTLSTSTTTR